MPQKAPSTLAVILGRVSTEEQLRKGYSLPEQMRECRRKAQELGATEILEFYDDKGGDLLDRPGLNLAREAVRQGKVRWFICYDPDRFSRSLKLQLLVADEIERAGTELLFVQHNYERTPEGQLFFQLRGAISEFEKAKIIERMSRGKRGKLRAGGIPSGFDAYGYSFVKGEGRLVIDPEEAAWIRRMFEWLTVERLSLTAIATRLNDLGVNPPRGPRAGRGSSPHWYKNTVRRILLNPLYTGQLHANRYDTSGRRHGGGVVERPSDEWITVQVPAIIGEALFQQAREIIAGSGQRRERPGRLLSGLVRCGICGVHFRYRTRRNETAYLECALRHPAATDFQPERRRQRCPTPSIRADRLEPFVWQRVRDWLLQPEQVGQLLVQPLDAGKPERLQTVERALAEAVAERESLTYLFVKGLTDRAQAEAALEELCRRIARLQAHRADLERRAARQQRETPQQADLMGSLSDALEALEPAVRRWVVETLVSSVEIDGPGQSDWRVIPST